MKNVFKNGGLYEDKKDVEPTPEEQEVINERIEEAEYLETIGSLHWVIYPWLKLLKRVCCCKGKATAVIKPEDLSTKKNEWLIDLACVE